MNDDNECEGCDDPEACEDCNPWVQVLCGCGWGNLRIRESDVPDYCPLCERPLPVADDSDDYADDFNDDMDGDAGSALASCGWGTDEDYGCYDGGW